MHAASIKNNNVVIMLVFSAISTLGFLAYLLYYSNYGFDFADEAYYLISMSNPSKYDISISQFGFILHPLYAALNGNLAHIRQATILATYALSFILHFVLLKRPFSGVDEQPGLLIFVTLAAGFSSVSALYILSWLPTASYNSLALQSMLITAIGLFVMEGEKRPKKYLAILLVGVGGWLSFMAKPSTAIALCLFTLVFFLMSKRFSALDIVSCAAVSLLGVVGSALIIDGSIIGFVERICEGIRIGGLLDSGHTVGEIMKIDKFLIRPSHIPKIPISIEFGYLCIGMMLVIYAVKLFDSDNSGRQGIALFISGLFVVIIFYCIGSIMPEPMWMGDYKGILLPGILASAGGVAFLLFRSASVAWGHILFFSLFPLVYAFGSNRSYVVAAGDASVFWVCASIVLLSPVACNKRSWIFALPFVLYVQVISVLLLDDMVDNPARQSQPLGRNYTEVSLGNPGSTIKLSEEHAILVEEVQHKIREAGFNVGTPVIDLTGYSPGVLYLIEAEILGNPWLIGGYPGSDQVARIYLSYESCIELSRAWILAEPEGEASLSSSLLNDFGADIFESYEEAANWAAGLGVGVRYKERRQIIYKPISSSKVREACEALRKELPRCQGSSAAHNFASSLYCDS